MKYKGFPKEISKGSARVLIYKVKHQAAKKGFVYSVAWNVGRLRKLKQFTALQKAQAFAKERLDILLRGDRTSLEISRPDLDELRAARKAAGKTPLVAAIEEWRRAREICDGNLIAAAQFWKSRNSVSIERISVKTACDRFLEAKERQGVDTYSSYGRTLPRFAERFGRTKIDQVTTTWLQNWLDSEFAKASTRNSHRKRIVALFRWCRRHGYLPKEARTEAEDVETAREEPLTIGIISPEQLREALEILEAKAPRYIPGLILAAQCGLRRSEVHGQAWDDINLERKFLRVSAAKRNTPAMRLVPVCDAAVEALRPRAGKGRMYSNLAIDRIRKICIRAGMKLPENCFRHSFISYRVAQTGDVARTSLEAGNSVKIIHSNYLELATEDEAVEYFGIGTGGYNGQIESNK